MSKGWCGAVSKCVTPNSELHVFCQCSVMLLLRRGINFKQSLILLVLTKPFLEKPFPVHLPLS